MPPAPLLNLAFRDMTRADIPAGLRLCRAAGWNQNEADWLCFVNGARLALLDGRIAGTVGTLRFEDSFAWISMLLVDPEFRRRGVGTALLMEALRLLAEVACVRLDATPAGKLVYDQCGFHDEHPMVRLRAESLRGGATLPPLRTLDPVRELDRAVFGADRGPVLDHLLAAAPDFAFHTDGAYALGRHGFHADHIGPVVARDEATARALVSAVHTGRPVLIDAPEHTPSWIGWLESIGFRRERPFMRMYRGMPPPTAIPEFQFAIAGPEFG